MIEEEKKDEGDSGVKENVEKVKDIAEDKGN